VHRTPSFFDSGGLMPDYRRLFQPGGTFFFTLVTHRRRPVFRSDEARQCLREAILDVQSERPFELVAIVLLPEHLHCVWKLPNDDSDFSKRWGRIKSQFTKSWLSTGGRETVVSAARAEHHECGVWQKRFWEHGIRDEEDFIHHVNYIDYNPVKHGLVRCPHEWPHSSFMRWVEQGYYRRDWLCECVESPAVAPDWLRAGDTFGE
jgi:putative transposase